MKQVLKLPLYRFTALPLLRLIMAMLFIALLAPSALRSQTTEPPYDPCATISSTSACMDDSHSCDEAQAVCSTGYCWSGGVPSDNAGIPGGGLVENKVIEIGGSYVITISATFKNCTFRMSGGSRINISPDGNDPISVVFDNCNIFGCGDLWQGIIVDASEASDDFTFTFLEGTIEDAYIGLQLDEFKGNYTIADNSFRNNHIGISNVRQNGGFLNASIVRNHFWQSAALADTTGLSGLPFPLPDYPLAHAGVKYSNLVSSVGVLETGVTGPTANIFECLRYGIWTENGSVQSISNIFKVMGLDGIHAADGILRVVSCQFVEKGINGIFAIGAGIKVQQCIFDGEWREGIHSEQNFNSERITINMNNQFTISYNNWRFGIYVQRPQATAGTHCIIDGNTFTVTSDPIDGLACIRFDDDVDAADEMEISRNNITVNSEGGGVNGIFGIMGKSDKLNIHDNTMYFGTLRDNYVSHGIDIVTASGQNLTKGHIFRNDTIIGNGVDSLLNSIYCAFHISSIDGAEFCNNVMDYSYHGMHFVHTNDVELRSNHFANHTYGLRIQGDSVSQIGIQLERGNQWDLDPDACVKFAAQVDGGNPLKSRFVVQDDVLPWLPDHDKIDPDPNGFGIPDWFIDGGTDMDAGCKSPLLLLERTLTPAEIEVVMDTSILSGTYLWDLKREVYAKLLIYPELRPTSSDEETFFDGLDGTLIDSLGQVVQQMRNGLSISSEDEADLDDYRETIESSFDDLAEIDESLDYSDIANLTGIWFADRKDLLEKIAEDAGEEVILEDARDLQLADDLEDALTYNSSITTSQPYGVARKLVNELQLRRLLAQPMTEGLYDSILALVQESEETHGNATKEIIRFLSPCDQIQYWINEENAEERKQVQQGLHSENKEALKAMPNPSAGFFEINIPQKTGDFLSVYNAYGQKVITQRISPDMSKSSLDLRLFPNGFYWIVLTEASGKVLGATKVSVSH